jgi:hypothetical protein
VVLPYTFAAFQRVYKSAAVALCIVYDADARIAINLDEFTVAPITNKATIYKYVKSFENRFHSEQ